MHKFGSIGQYKNVIKSVSGRCNLKRLPLPELVFKGTVKIHGSNSSIYNVLSNDELIIQSRNNIITVDSDNHGFAQYITEKELVVCNMFSQIKEMFPQFVQTKTAVIYGEWCGGNIQPGEGLGIKMLEKMYVVFAVKLTDNGSNDETQEIWLSENEIKHIFFKVGKDLLKENKIYNTYDFPSWEIKIDMNNPKLSQNKLIEITNQVEKECPVAKTFGISGIGEGVVWKCISEIDGIETKDLIFKVKGQEHSVSNVTSTAAVDEEKVKSTNEFIEKVVTKNRLMQGLEYLKENHLELNTANTGVFIKWVAADCLKEEIDMMNESGLVLKEVMPAISNKAKQWYFTQIVENNPKFKF